ncbi:BON domain-containing protein [Planctomycetota bacterium]
MGDENISESCTRARNALAASPVYALRRLCVEKVGDSVIITGRVPSFYQKQMAQEIVRHAIDKLELVNSIDVD